MTGRPAEGATPPTPRPTPKPAGPGDLTLANGVIVRANLRKGGVSLAAKREQLAFDYKIVMTRAAAVAMGYSEAEIDDVFGKGAA